MRTVPGVAELAARLVEIESINPDVVPGGSGEGPIAAFVADWCAAAGLDVTVEEPSPGRPNVIAVAPGRGGGGTLLLNAHMDTVGVAGMESPFVPRLDGTRLYGRGAYDMKGSLAASMLAVASAREHGLRGDVVLAAVADEEYASVGSAAVAAGLRADAAIVTEPTGMSVAICHRGFVHAEVLVRGRAAHGSRPDLGIDAIAKAGRVLVGIEDLDRELRADPRHPLLGSGSVHASLIEGGQEFSSYPARCRVELERRTIPGETAATVERELGSLLARARGGDPQFDAQLSIVLARDAFAVEPGARVVRAVVAAAEEVLGEAPALVGAAFWADAALFAAAGVPTVMLGPRGDGAHAEVEWVDATDLERCREIYVRAAVALCG
jgi:acetylornithine deacetylase